MKIALAAALMVSAAFPAMANDELSDGQRTDSGYALFDLNYSSFDLSADGNQNRYDDGDGVAAPNGQARVRYGDFIGEIQGMFTGNTDEYTGRTKEYGSASFGMIGHYVHSYGDMEIALSTGVIGGQANESDTTINGLLGAAVAGENWSLGVGHMKFVSGGDQSADGQALDFNYIHGSYALAISDRTNIFASGHIGSGDDRNSDSLSSYNVDFGVSHNMNDQIALVGAIGGFGMERQDQSPDEISGMSVSLGMTIALGGSQKAAKNAIRFDTPNLHREATWMDDFGYNGPRQ